MGGSSKPLYEDIGIISKKHHEGVCISSPGGPIRTRAAGFRIDYGVISEIR